MDTDRQRPNVAQASEARQFRHLGYHRSFYPASVAAYENEVRSERIVVGQEVARANGKRWGGRKAGQRAKVNNDQVETIRALYASKKSIAAIARTVGLSRPTIYSVLCADSDSSL